jgi:hypothetical protein
LLDKKHAFGRVFLYGFGVLSRQICLSSSCFYSVQEGFLSLAAFARLSGLACFAG